MAVKQISPKLVEWVEKLHAAGATFLDGDEMKLDPRIRECVRLCHCILAGSPSGEKFTELEAAFESAFADSSELAQADGPEPLFP